MIYIVEDKDRPGKLLVVKADDEKDIENRLLFREGHSILGRLTDNEINTISTTGFCVIQA